MEPGPSLTHYTKINSKWIPDLNVNTKLLEKDTRNYGDLEQSKAILDLILKALYKKEKTDKLDLVKI